MLLLAIHGTEEVKHYQFVASLVGMTEQLLDVSTSYHHEIEFLLVPVIEFIEQS